MLSCLAAGTRREGALCLQHHLKLEPQLRDSVLANMLHPTLCDEYVAQSYRTEGFVWATKRSCGRVVRGLVPFLGDS